MLKGKTQDECILESASGESEPFTDSDPWRVFRIMGEFVEGFDTLAGLGAAISIFGSGAHAVGRSQLPGGCRDGAPVGGIRSFGHYRRRAGHHGGRQPRRAAG